MPFKKFTALPSPKANPGIRAAYRRQVQALIQQIADAAEKEILAFYGKHEDAIGVAQDAADIAQDAARKPREWRLVGNERRTIASRTAFMLELFYKRWSKKSFLMADRIANKSLEAMRSRVEKMRLKSLQEKGISVRLHSSRVTNERFAYMIQENAMAIQGLSDEYVDKVASAVMRCASAGMDREQLTKDMASIFGTTMKKAVNLSRDQSLKCTQTLAQSVDRDLGFSEGIWVHMPGRKMSRPTHVAMNGKRFHLDKGLWDSDEERWTTPGAQFLCACTYKPIIPENWRS